MSLGSDREGQVLNSTEAWSSSASQAQHLGPRATSVHWHVALGTPTDTYTLSRRTYKYDKELLKLILVTSKMRLEVKDLLTYVPIVFLYILYLNT